jgi:hypothetical protein
LHTLAVPIELCFRRLEAVEALIGLAEVESKAFSASRLKTRAAEANPGARKGPQNNRQRHGDRRPDNAVERPVGQR